ncbi:hypothetical protein Gogos_012857 [Gossypium gossypioides]|uniref:Uncharacterized protein n=1 Tax=Gossypium gossypioides TaxID=34282 RepID=A0A7J9BTS8_GOSGO|nr:hypothetical protein [Gossypium gossypioides]
MGGTLTRYNRTLRKPLRKWALSKFISNEADGLWAIQSQCVRIKAIQKETS